MGTPLHGGHLCAGRQALRGFRARGMSRMWGGLCVSRPTQVELTGDANGGVQVVVCLRVHSAPHQNLKYSCLGATWAGECARVHSIVARGTCLYCVGSTKRRSIYSRTACIGRCKGCHGCR